MKKKLKILRFEACSVEEAEKMINEYMDNINVIDFVSVNIDPRIGYLIVRMVILIGVENNEK
mgnify:FL=1